MQYLIYYHCTGGFFFIHLTPHSPNGMADHCTGKLDGQLVTLCLATSNQWSYSWTYKSDQKGTFYNFSTAFYRLFD